MKVKDALHKKAEWVGPDTSVAEVAKKMKDLDIGSIPVGENGRLIGKLSVGDVSHATPHELTGELMAAVSWHHG